MRKYGSKKAPPVFFSSDEAASVYCARTRGAIYPELETMSNCVHCTVHSVQPGQSTLMPSQRKIYVHINRVLDAISPIREGVRKLVFLVPGPKQRTPTTHPPLRFRTIQKIDQFSTFHEKIICLEW